MNQNHGCELRSKPNCHRTQTFSLPHHLNSKWAKVQIRNMILHRNNKENQQSPHLASHLFITSLYFQSNHGRLHFHQHQVFMFSCADKKRFYLPLPEPLMMELCIKVFIILKRLMQLLKPSWKCSLLGSFSWHAHRAKATKTVIVQKLADKMWTSLSRHQGRGLTHARCRLQEHRSDLTADILNAALSAETRFIFQLWETRRTPTHQVWLCLN